MEPIAVIGGGLTGLAAAYRLLRAGEQVQLFEASPRVGGQLHTLHEDGCCVELGAEGFVAGSQATLSLAGALGISSDVIDQRVLDSCLYDGKSLHPLPRGEAGRKLGFRVNPKAFGRGIQSLRGGMGQLIEALLSEFQRLGGITLLRATPIETLRSTADGPLELITGDTRTFQASQVVVALPSRATASLLAPLSPAAAALEHSKANSSLTISLLYQERQIVDPLIASGFVVADGVEVLGMRACSYSSIKLAHRAPSTHTLLRVFLRPTDEQLHLSDPECATLAARALGTVIRIQGPAEKFWVSRWKSTLPVVDDSHTQRVAALERALVGRNVALAGSAFHGAGIDGALRSANAAADRILALSASRGDASSQQTPELK